MVGLQTLDLAIGVRVPASQPKNQALTGDVVKTASPVCVPVTDRYRIRFRRARISVEQTSEVEQ